ncbi:hypothetical protein CGI74_23225 [Vibrio parahaemolyticus]|nr:hypothetical protein CGI74_23225 [Vibrio parahaemolyticus]TOM84677.1 hypothetical protein CGH68_22960 [Vibrio parahaemolyticus]
MVWFSGKALSPLNAALCFKANYMKLWKVRGYDGMEEILSFDIPMYTLSEKQVQQLLKTLVAKYSLSNEEIISSYLNGRSKCRSNLLDVHRLGLRPEFTCGENPYFTAVIIEK